MEYADKIKASMTSFLQNKSLLSVLILEFILTTIVGIFFFIGDVAVLSYMNKEALAQLPPTIEDFRMLLAVFMNAKTIALALLLVLVQGVIFVYIDSFFKAGFCGMLKNVIKDGTTTFAEFIPEAKRFWHTMFRFLLIRYAIMPVAALPFLFGLIVVAGTTPEFITPSQLVLFFTGLGIVVLVGILTFFWMLYGEAVIVFEEETAINSITTSAQLANRNVSTTIVTLLVVIGLFVGATIVSMLVLLPFDLLLKSSPSTPLAIVRDILNFFLNIITIFITIICSIFIFHVYHALTMHTAVRKHPVHASKTVIKRKR